MKLNAPLLALSIGAFGIGTTEFAPMGLLPVIAKNLQVSIPTAGLLITAYAVGVVVGAPLLTLPTERIARNRLLIALMVLFTAGNLLSALSRGYLALLAARVITSLCHGAYFGVGSLVAAKLVGKGRSGGAVAAVFAGLTVANIGGVPAATYVGEHFGWRAAFFGIAFIGALAAAALAAVLPCIAPAGRSDIHGELKVVTRGQVLLALATTVLGSGAMFTVFTYIAPILEVEAQASQALLTVALVVYGVGLTIGNWLGGHFADKNLKRTLLVVLVALVLLLMLFAVTMRSPTLSVATVFAWGIATFALVPSLQARIMQVASDAPTLASSLNIGAFNLGNALGAVLGAEVIREGLGYPWVSAAGAGMAAAALALLLFARFEAPNRSAK